MRYRSGGKHLCLTALVALACVAPSLVLYAPASAQVVRASEMMSGGGAAGQSASYRIHDTIAQCPIGTVPGSGTTRLHDGFWLTLPGINVPVEGTFFATLAASETAILRWTVGSLVDVEGFNVYRSTSRDGPFARVNADLLPAQSPGSFEDATLWPQTTFWYELRALRADGSEDAVGDLLASVTTTGRLVARLDPPSPNPCTGRTAFQLEVPDHVGPATLIVYNIQGQEVRRLVDGAIERGRPVVTWSGGDKHGRPVSSGVYLVRFEVDGKSGMQKVLVLR